MIDWSERLLSRSSASVSSIALRCEGTGRTFVELAAVAVPIRCGPTVEAGYCVIASGSAAVRGRSWPRNYVFGDDVCLEPREHGASKGSAMLAELVPYGPEAAGDFGGRVILSAAISVWRW